MREINKDSILTQYRLEKEEQSRKKIKEYFITGQISPEIAMYMLRILGFSNMRGKEIVKDWTNEKSNA